MGLLRDLKSNQKKSEAAAIIRTLLELETLDLDPAKTADLLVANAWETMPEVFNGRLGPCPHKLTVAATALAAGIKTARNDEYQSVLLLSLGKILKQVKVNGSLYSLNGVDVRLLISALELFAENTRDYRHSSGLRQKL